jgi:hypothetical protein
MKQKFKIYPKLIGILAIFMLISCSKDEFVNHIKKSQNKNEISFEQFKKETGLNNFSTTININPVNQQNISTSRLANGSYELSDFYISTDIIKKLESANITSYTFRIYPKEYREEDAKKIFNLSLYKIGNIWETTIIQFTPTQINYESIKQGLTEQVEGKAKLLYKGDLTTYSTSGNACFEITIISSYCEGCTGGSCDANSADGCPAGVCYVNTSSFIICYYIGDENGSGGGFSGVGPPGDGIGPIGGPGGDGVSIIYNDPNALQPEDPRPMTPNVKDTSVDGHNFENDNILPCDQLKNFSKMEPLNRKTPNLKAKIDEIKEYASDTNFEHEVIYSLMKDSNGNYGTTPLVIASEHKSAKPRLYGYFYGAIHSHTPNLSPMFSWSDVYGLKSLFDGAAPYNKSEVTLLLVASESATSGNVLVYALKIDDINALTTKLNADMINPDDPNNTDIKNKIKYADSKFKEKFKDNMNNQDLEKVFLDNFANAGISIYKANNDELTDWNKLSLNNNPTNPITKTPCN